ncbi:hypothetical protein [Acetobacterium bakii]|uniref:Uncharacterized protein n=1 Tax=Acetobacterium bakii TaxID=52689 RepID=A0A0L6U2Z8_9FIRM|nr:hypothetical protein [Acetobacterium bakii]KNZ42742.1 hypothetical protein AKG39_04725 [Acetobacterium bakii]
MSYFSEYENLIQNINADIAVGIIAVTDHIKVVRKRKTKTDGYRPINDYYYASNHPKVKFEEMRVCDVLQELLLRNMMR